MKLLSKGFVSKQEFDRTLEDILQRPEYRHLERNLRDYVEAIREAINQWLLELLRNAFSNMSEIPAISGTLSTVFIILGLFMILGLTVFIVVRASKAFERRKKVKVILGERIDEKTTPESLRGKAAAFVREGDFRQAVRYDFIALLLFMHEKNLVYLDETKTNEEIYQYLKKNRFSMLDIFQVLTDMFNASWYGHKAYCRETYDQWHGNINRIWGRIHHDENENR